MTKTKPDMSKRKEAAAAHRRKEYRILLFKDVAHSPVQLRLSTQEIVLACAAGMVVVFLLITLTLGFYYNAQRYNESETNRSQISDTNEQALQRMKLQNELLTQKLEAEMKENQQLKENQQQEIQELQDIAEATRQKLEDMKQREEEVRSQLGIEPEIPEEDTAAVSHGLIQTSVTAHSLPLLRQSYSSLQNQLDSQISKYSGFSDIITTREYEARKASTLRTTVVSYALRFLGGRYVYGGNDPNSGVDCSGFTRYVLSHTAGLGLNRTAAAQSGQGTAVTIDQARPGDLIFYGSKSNISHVAIYIGNGKVVHASTEKTGIITSPWDYRTPVKIRNVLGK